LYDNRVYVQDETCRIFIFENYGLTLLETKEPHPDIVQYNYTCFSSPLVLTDSSQSGSGYTVYSILASNKILVIDSNTSIATDYTNPEGIKTISSPVMIESVLYYVDIECKMYTFTISTNLFDKYDYSTDKRYSFYFDQYPYRLKEYYYGYGLCLSPPTVTYSDPSNLQSFLLSVVDSAGFKYVYNTTSNTHYLKEDTGNSHIFLFN
jgi:hypothetical protein